MLGIQVCSVALGKPRSYRSDSMAGGVDTGQGAQALDLHSPLYVQRQVNPESTGFVLQRRQRTITLYSVSFNCAQVLLSNYAFSYLFKYFPGSQPALHVSVDRTSNLHSTARQHTIVFLYLHNVD